MLGNLEYRFNIMRKRDRPERGVICRRGQRMEPEARYAVFPEGEFKARSVLARVCHKYWRWVSIGPMSFLLLRADWGVPLVGSQFSA